MGNTGSSNKKNFLEDLETLVSELIIKQSWKDMQKMENVEYCDKLVIITTEVLEKHLNDRELAYLEERIKEGGDQKTHVQKLSWIRQSELDTLNSGKNRKLQCQGIAKFYIRIAHVYTAIIKTINPQYVLNTDGEQKIPLLQYGDLPKDIEKKLTLFGFCQRRIDALQYEKGDDDMITVFPSPCKLIQKKYRDEQGTCRTKYKTFSAEPGVPELLQLYKDVFNYKSGKFSRVSADSMKQYRYDLKKFYKTFTGKTLPDDITRFSQIKLADYSCRYDPRIKCASKIASTNKIITARSYQPVTLDTSNASSQTKPLLPPTSPPTARPPVEPPTEEAPRPPPPYEEAVAAVPSTETIELPPDKSSNLGIQVGGNHIRHKSYTGKKSSDNFSKYANHLARMIEYAKKGQEGLLNILSKLFTPKKGEKEKIMSYTLNSELNQSNLDKIIIETRNTIVQLYIKCEQDFRKGLELFDDIIEEKEIQKIESQEKHLKKELSKVIDD